MDVIVEEEQEILGTFPFPVGVFEETPVEELFLPDEVNEYLDFSSLFYTDNLNFNYNYPMGFFRPYGWPEGEYNEEKIPGVYHKSEGRRC